ncbi:hypothetical protein ORV05_28425 [Amycolatopsis cynarae]|uniref:Serine/threonine protein kinase n=1 Tax=Amycolatopsis cynarae TaxID=2995223 RepID=A0ABY7B1P2_9PSEU|nr:hypothetical protein [Amycolatopsis sp. HUAS 11-8]WAL64831.1 hypothetical protein ORV05_28425 [Amycolatopsis sp. HUAS 11-8]
MTFTPSPGEQHAAYPQTDAFTRPGMPPQAPTAAEAAPAPAAKPVRKFSSGVLAVLAAATLVVGGSVGFVIGHGTGSGSQTPPSMGQGVPGYGGQGGPDGYGPPGMNGGTGQDSSAGNSGTSG